VIKASTIVKCDETLNSVCQNNVCNPSTGKCNLNKKPDGLSCNADDSLCTKGDACKDGICAQGAMQQCDDNNKCTDDSCDPTLGCKYNPNTNPCDKDDNACTENDACLLGTCVAGKSNLCANEDQCIEGKCSIVTGKCGYTFKEGFPCSDASPCTLSDKCTSNTCVGTAANCDDNKACTSDSCDPKVGCVHTNASAVCSDNDACTESDLCIAGACKGTPSDPKKCDDNKSCTTDSCDAAKGCLNAAAPGDCDDGNPCTLNDVCKAGTCESGTNTCGCGVDSDCADDGNLCNGVQFCNKAKLPYKCAVNEGSIPSACDTSISGQCQDNECVPSTGKCVVTKQPDGLGCNADSNACTNLDSCLSGKCVVGKVLVCDDQTSARSTPFASTWARARSWAAPAARTRPM